MAEAKSIAHVLLALILYRCLTHSLCATANNSSSPIKTVVVVVMENRSFDHMLGWMKRLNPGINGVTGRESNPLSTTNASSPLLLFTQGSTLVDPDPGHSYQAIFRQVFGHDNYNATAPDQAPMDGFADQACSMDCANMPHAVMSGFHPDRIPVYRQLIEEFAVFDRWFASVPASTQPNRLFVHSATSHGATGNVAALLAKGYPQQTIFDSLDDAGLPFGIYFQNIPATLFFKNLRKLKHLGKFHPYGLSFEKHAREGKLPAYAVVEQRYLDTKLDPANDDHPSHDVAEGQRLVKEVYEALRSSPQWNQTLLLVTYDEHGGYFDHVPTPTRGVPSPDGIVGPEPFFFRFDRLGVRVPTLAISPWINKRTVIHGTNGSPYPTSEYEHSSIPATVKKIFNMSTPFLTRRDAWAGTFEGIVQTRKEPRTDCPVTLPDPVKMREGEANEDAKPSEFQQELLQLAAVLKGDNLLAGYPESIQEIRSIREAKEYMEDAVSRFFEAGRLAQAMGVDGEQIVQMRPSLTTRSSKTSNKP